MAAANPVMPTVQPTAGPNGPAGPATTPQGTAAPAHPGGAPQPGESENHKSLHQKGRAKIPWSRDVWERIDKAVEMEFKRSCISARFLPRQPVPPKTTSVPTDSYTLSTSAAPNSTPVLTVDEGATTRINEYYVEFELTPQQVDQEEVDFKLLGHSTAVTLALKATNTLVLGHDSIVFQGANAIQLTNLFTQDLVLTLNANTPLDTGILNFPANQAAPAQNALNVIQVPPLNPAVQGVTWGSQTFEAVAQAYSQLQAIGQSGPYAAILHYIPYADTFAPLPATLTLTADRIKPLMTAGFFGAGTVPPNPAPPSTQNPSAPPAAPYFGLVVSIGGNTMDYVAGLEPLVAFMQEDTNGNFRFRVLERFALRLKDPTAVQILQFNAAGS
jgi:uncharacterized linocin/CFP29 family protein